MCKKGCCNIKKRYLNFLDFGQTSKVNLLHIQKVCLKILWTRNPGTTWTWYYWVSPVNQSYILYTYVELSDLLKFADISWKHFSRQQAFFTATLTSARELSQHKGIQFETSCNTYIYTYQPERSRKTYA